MAESQSGLLLFCLHNLCGWDRSGQVIVVLTIAEHVAWCNPVAVEMFTLHTDYHSSTLSATVIVST